MRLASDKAESRGWSTFSPATFSIFSSSFAWKKGSHWTLIALCGTSLPELYCAQLYCAVNFSLFCNLPGLYYVVLCTWIIMGFNFYLNCSALSISTWLCYLPWLCYVVLSTWIVMGFNFYLNCNTWLPISTITVHSISTFITLFG